MTMHFKAENWKSFLVNLAYDLVGCILMAMAVKIFSAPNQIAPGGVTGVATMINYLTKFPIGTMSLLLNIPLILIAYRKLGRRFSLKTLQTVIINTFAVDVIVASPPVYTGDPMLAALFGGVLTGIGAGLVFMRGSTSGGTDIVNKLIQKRYPYIPIGQLVVGINSIVILTAALVYQNIEAALYGLIMTFTCGKVMDAMLYGADTGKSCLIVTHKPNEISQAIIDRLHRSATILNGTGAFKKDNTWVIVCVVRKQEFFHLKDLIREADPQAFVIVSEAHQIIGRGFKPIDSSDN